MTLCLVDRPALVLGSTQPAGHVGPAAAAAGVAVVRRRSGGAAVLVEPGQLAWVEVVLPAGDALWQADVGRAAWWLGEAWAAALASLGAPGAVVHRGGAVAAAWSPYACFAGLGPGEVTLAGRKVVGLSQRRGRPGAVFQCAVPRRWAPERLVALLALGRSDRARLAGALADGAGAAVAAPADAVVGALVAHLPATH